MGCDIHLHTEVKINGKWEHYGEPSIDRSYDLFGKMAGVRRDVEPIAQPKGVPEGLSAVTAFDYALDGPDAHTLVVWRRRDRRSMRVGQRRAPLDGLGDRPGGVSVW